MHFHPVLLVQAESIEDAKRKAEDFVDGETGEHAYFDYGGIVPDKESEFNKPVCEVRGLLPHEDHLEKAMSFVEKAKEKTEQKEYGMAGFYYKKAGLLLEQSFCTESLVFNIQSDDYRRNPEEDGWYAIEADFHC
ncbi:MAG: hypothetical protein LBQ88_09395 [Treponema sp.]|nr:hypothetical protein [Treponema sp.]